MTSNENRLILFAHPIYVYVHCMKQVKLNKTLKTAHVSIEWCFTYDDNPLGRSTHRHFHYMAAFVNPRSYTLTQYTRQCLRWWNASRGMLRDAIVSCTNLYVYIETENVVNYAAYNLTYVYRVLWLAVWLCIIMNVRRSCMECPNGCQMAKTITLRVRACNKRFTDGRVLCLMMMIDGSIILQIEQRSVVYFVIWFCVKMEDQRLYPETLVQGNSICWELFKKYKNPRSNISCYSVLSAN